MALDNSIFIKFSFLRIYLIGRDLQLLLDNKKVFYVQKWPVGAFDKSEEDYCTRTLTKIFQCS